jgi:homocysteine S-methyltransferase
MSSQMYCDLIPQQKKGPGRPGLPLPCIFIKFDLDFSYPLLAGQLAHERAIFGDLRDLAPVGLAPGLHEPVIFLLTMATEKISAYPCPVMIVDPLQNFLNRQGFAMLDGGLATEMEKHGADLDDDLWSAKMLIEAPELVRQVHSDFLNAGADIIATASYQASIDGFAKAGHSRHQAEQLMRLSVDLAVLARETFWAETTMRHQRLKPLVAASIGPYGATLHDGSEYHGNYDLSRQELMDFHRPRMEILADTDADIFAFETIPSMLEAEALLDLLNEFPEKPAWLSFSCRNGKNVSHGESFAACIELASQSSQVVAAGVNCTAPEFIGTLLDSVHEVDLPLLVYPNSGEQWNPEGNQWTGQGCTSAPVLDWHRKGAKILGGCCRISSEAIKNMRTDMVRFLNEDRAK